MTSNQYVGFLADLIAHADDRKESDESLGNFVRANLAEAREQAEELVKWPAACTGKHGSQMNCMSEIGKPLHVDPRVASLLAENESLRWSLSEVKKEVCAVTPDWARALRIMDQAAGPRPAVETKACPECGERERGTAALRAAFGEELWQLGHPAYIVAHLREEHAKMERLWKEASTEADRLRRAQKASVTHESWCETLEVRACNCGAEKSGDDPHGDLPIEQS